MKRAISLISIISILLVAFIFVLPASATEYGAPDYYGRSALAGCENATALLYAYDAAVAGIEESAAEIGVYNGTDKLSVEELETVIDAVRRDRADLFWLANEYSVKYIGDSTDSIETVTALLPTYSLSGDALKDARAQVEARAAVILAELNGEMTDFEKALYIHDTLAARIEYIDTEHSHNLYGALVIGEAVCEGYAEALQYLLHRAGIEAFLAIGSSINPSTNQPEGHEWSYARLDGEWTHIDLTWNDQGDTTYHAYFGLTDGEIAADHIIDTTVYALPVCTSTANNYFNVKGTRLTAPYSADTIISIMRSNGRRAQLAVDDTAAFVEWFGDNASTIAAGLGVSGDVDYGYSILGNEVLVYIGGDCSHPEPNFVMHRDAECEEAGCIDHYCCSICGALFADALCRTPITEQEAYTDALGHDYTSVNEVADFEKDAGDCMTERTYWYACSRCGKSAGNDPEASDKYYTGTTFGDHIMAEGWKNENGTHYRACTVGGCEFRTDEGECTGGEPTCTALARCDVCGAGYGELAEHSYDTERYVYPQPKDGHAYSCTSCGQLGELTPHASAEGGEATEDTPELCAECGYIITPALNHGANHTSRDEWLSDETGHWHGCNGCEEQRLEEADHTDGDGDLLCDVCAFALDPKPEGEPSPIVDPLPDLIKMLEKEHFIYIGIGAAVLVILAIIIKIAGLVHRRRRW